MNLEPFENLDRLLQVEFRPEGIPSGIVPRLYQIVRSQSERPVTYEAASALLALKDGSRVALVTGIAFEHLPHGEVDGPIGAAVLAHALTALDIRADVLVETPILPVVEAIRNRLGGTFRIVDTALLSQDEAVALAANYDAAITIEKLGKNAKGVRHSIMGTQLPPEKPSLDEFIAALNAAEKLTIGLGDGGNEMGFGAIFEHARDIVPKGAACGCPCGDGTVTATATGILLPANVSNFGAYGIVAALGILTRKAWLLPSGETVVALIEAAVQAGCIDGGSAKPHVVGDDGIPGSGVSAFVNTMGVIISQTFIVFDRHF